MLHALEFSSCNAGLVWGGIMRLILHWRSPEVSIKVSILAAYAQTDGAL